jgi:hypothetical protein
MDTNRRLSTVFVFSLLSHHKLEPDTVFLNSAYRILNTDGKRQMTGTGVGKNACQQQSVSD